jgi:hypothetical protein
MLISDLEFKPYEGEFNGSQTAMIVEYWTDENRGIRLVDDHSVSSQDVKMYYTTVLKKENGTITESDMGYQTFGYVQEIIEGMTV